MLMLTQLSFFLGVFVSYSVCCLEDKGEEELALALQVSSYISLPAHTTLQTVSLCVTSLGPQEGCGWAWPLGGREAGYRHHYAGQVGWTLFPTHTDHTPVPDVVKGKHKTKNDARAHSSLQSNLETLFLEWPSELSPPKSDG